MRIKTGPFVVFLMITAAGAALAREGKGREGEMSMYRFRIQMINGEIVSLPDHKGKAGADLSWRQHRL